ncbi:MAG: hypothetical protein M3R61_11115 [Chloroflexota bacterium]|nr:hypothetical protein [Chloroflexota bacterium]
MTDNSEQRDLILMLARAIVHDAAPEELDLFDEYAVAYLDNPDPRAHKQQAPDSPLASGIPDILQAITPVATAMASAAIAYLLPTTAQIVREGVSDVFKERLKLFLSRKAIRRPVANPSPISVEQLNHIRRIAIQQARQFGISAAEADILANALIGQLAAPLHASGDDTDLLSSLLENPL